MNDFANQLGLHIVNALHETYWMPLRKELDAHPELQETFPALLLNPESISIYLGNTHIGVEYHGPLFASEIRDFDGLSCHIFDYRTSDHFVDAVLGIDYSDSTIKDFRMPLGLISHELYMPTNAAHDLLLDSGWNFAGQTMMMGLNVPGFDLTPGSIHRLVDCFFYGTNNSHLKTRHVKWLDFFPCKIDETSSDEFDTISWNLFPNCAEQAKDDARFSFKRVPDFQVSKLRQLNRFVELFSAQGAPETEITSFLAREENNFILKIAFNALEVGAQEKGVWTDPERQAIQPDFVIEKSNGFADILEFKLPDLGGNVLVGGTNRETFSSYLHSYVAQTRVYEEYFEDPANRERFQKETGFQVKYPDRLLVVGRRHMFSGEIWRSVERDYRNIRIFTFDDIVDTVRSALYS